MFTYYFRMSKLHLLFNQKRELKNINNSSLLCTFGIEYFLFKSTDINIFAMKTRILFCILLLLVPHLYSFSQQDTAKVKVGEKVPEFEFEITPGVIQNITDLKGKLVMITFFATWCGPCRQELLHIQEDIYNKYKNDVYFKLLIFGREHNWEEVNKFQTDNKYTMPFYPDPERGIFSKFADQFIPRTYLISHDGKILYSSVGYTEKDFDALRQKIREELRKVPVK